MLTKQHSARTYEARSVPSNHRRRCDGTIYDATISRQRLILVCYDCRTFWHTGLKDEGGYYSIDRLTQAAQVLYALPKDERRAQLRRIHSLDIEKLYRYYQRGEGCPTIGQRVGVSASVIWSLFKHRGYRLRPRKLSNSGKPPIIWNGRRYHYTSGKRSYVSSGRRGRRYLARDIWEHYCGAIPEGYEICHLDGNPTNNDLSNLACVTRSEGTKHHVKRRGQFKQDAPVRHCAHCGKLLERRYLGEKYQQRTGGWEPYQQFLARHFCDAKCSNAAQKGKPRDWSPANPIERQYPEKHCLHCGEQLHPKTQVGGKLDGVVEAPNAFNKRQTCNPQCAAALKKGKPKGCTLRQAVEQAAD